jgi:hypothetical protein
VTGPVPITLRLDFQPKPPARYNIRHGQSSIAQHLV